MRFPPVGFLLAGALLLVACGSEAPAPPADGQRSDPPDRAGQAPGDEATQGLQLFRQGRLIAAEPLLQAALRAAPDDPRLLEALGAIYALSDRPAEAEALLRRVTAGSSVSFGAWFYLARVLADTGRDEDALEAIRAARHRDPGPLAGLIEEAKLLSRLGRCGDAEPVAREAIARDATRVEPLVVLAHCLQERGALDEAAATLRDALAIEEEHLGALSRLATIEMRRGHVEEAERLRLAHRRALERHRVEDRVRGPRRTAVAEFGRGEFDAALAGFREVARETPEDPQIHLHLGATLIALQRYDEALDELQICLQLDPTEGRAHTELGRLHALQGRFDAAFESLRHASALNPDDPEPYYVRAGLHRARGEEDLYRREFARFEELLSRFEEPAERSPAQSSGEIP